MAQQVEASGTGLLDDVDGKRAVELEIIRNSFFATVRQAGRIVLRSSFSPIIRDAFDFCVTLIGPHDPPELNFDVVAMNESLAHFSGVMPFMVRNMLWEYGVENLEPGDMIALNNPYKGGNHIYDNGFFKPVFYDGELIGGVALKAHLMDMGGVAAGGYSVQKRNVWEEGVVISGVPVYKQGEPYVPGFNLYFDNSRLPDNMLADLQALHSAATFAEQRLLALAEKYGKEVVREAMAYALDYADRSIRDGLAAIPDGDYEGEDGLDADAYNDEPYIIRCRIKKRGERIEVDFSGSTREAESSINCSAYDTANGVYTALKFLCDPRNPNNSGAFRAVDVVVPEGTFLAARPPAATTEYFDAAEAVFNAVVKALLPALGKDAIAGHFSTNMGLLVAGRLPAGGRPLSRSGREEIAHRLSHGTHGIPVKLSDAGEDDAGMFIAPLFCLGGFGASGEGDGEDFISMSQQNIMDMSVEAIELDYPAMILRKEYAEDTAGPGQFRGGTGIYWDRLILTDAEVRPLMLHMRIRPWSSHGGEEGRPGGIWIGAPKDDPVGWVRDVDRDASPNSELDPIAGFYDDDQEPSTKEDGRWVFGLRDYQVGPNTLFRQLTPAGGGWGDPFQRDPARVLKDVRDGFVSVRGAKRDYGVVIIGDPQVDPEGLRIDHEETERLRKG